jgi:uncharacterized membrane protein
MVIAQSWMEVISVIVAVVASIGAIWRIVANTRTATTQIIRQAKINPGKTRWIIFSLNAISGFASLGAMIALLWLFISTPSSDPHAFPVFLALLIVIALASNQRSS